MISLSRLYTVLICVPPVFFHWQINIFPSKQNKSTSTALYRNYTLFSMFVFCSCNVLFIGGNRPCTKCTLLMKLLFIGVPQLLFKLVSSD